MDSISFLNWLEAAIPPLSFLLILWALLEPEYSRRITQGAALGFWALTAAAQAVVFALGKSPELVVTLLPLTLYLPAILCLHFLSGSRFFPIALTWLLALLADHLLAALRKLLAFLRSGLSGPAWDWVFAAFLLLAAFFLLPPVSGFFADPFSLMCGNRKTAGRCSSFFR